MESWDDENFEPEEIAPPAVIIPTNKWEGEDEDDEVKDNWEDEDEEQKIEESKVVVPTKPKKKLDIAEKEKLKKEQEKQQRELEESEELTPEERIKLQRESDLQAALDTFGDNNASVALDTSNPVTKEEFDELADALLLKVQPLTKSSEFPLFAETVVRNICASMSSADIKKIKNTLDNLYLEKQKIEKGDKTKKNKGKGKAKLKLDNENQYSAYVDDYDDFNDFM